MTDTAPDRYLDRIFTPQRCNLPAELGDLGHAFQALVLQAASEISTSLPEYIRFDPVALVSFLVRFQRDAFGVYFFHEKVDQVAKGLPAESISEIKAALGSVGIRINSPSPRKTRIAAAFSLWMSACRPFSVQSSAIDGVTLHVLQTLPGRINFWIVAAFLSKFGDVQFGEGDDAKERVKRIFYDLTFRDLNLSSLEILYSSILRVKA